MTDTAMGIIWFLLHLFCCSLIYMGIRTRALKVRMYMMPFVLFVPVSGAACCLALHFQLFFRGDDGNHGGMEKMRLQEEVYKSISVENQSSREQIISLEEALIINDAGTRRNLMMDVLNDHPEEYMDVLLMARMNEDVEVVHYAATAMAELARDYDSRLQSLERSWKEDPQNEEAQQEYSSFLHHYLQQGIAQGQMERTQRERYSHLLTRQMEKRPTLSGCKNVARNEMELGNFERAGEILSRMEGLWQDHQEVCMLKVEYYARTGQGEALQRQIREIDRKGIYLFRENRRRLEFWRKQDCE